MSSARAKVPGDTGPGGKGEIYVFDVGPDNKVSNQKLFTDCVVDGVKCGPDGMRCDVNGNVWASSNAGRSVGYSGVTVWSPEGKLIGRIRLPEICGNVCFSNRPFEVKRFQTIRRCEVRTHLIHRPARDIIPPLGGARVSSYRM